jgi:hypothetical protein
MGTELTAVEAAKSLNFYDRRAMKKEFGVSTSDENPDELDFLTAVAWIVETRANPSVKPDDFKRMSVQQIDDYFASDDADPLDGRNGKMSTVPSLAGASTPVMVPMSTGN